MVKIGVVGRVHLVFVEKHLELLEYTLQVIDNSELLVELEFVEQYLGIDIDHLYTYAELLDNTVKMEENEKEVGSLDMLFDEIVVHGLVLALELMVANVFFF
eukprot:CAMPEP_0206170296 /NCGR_PEP_ID=MMETSP1474-20131121/38563_1 /ASSEMBLY_ACC=CAM_ASM_001110 /TAXON_ID=97495 /ORGANISM="Imantonia sp., Strain RCC918" /LENGTH=101 /DNA_ID=CAMNT_0053576907 /DNA_START=115 /DNA_END=420 /DNA_ORIENTATION=-